jgi:peroxiredoxin Q/BCP
MKTEHIFRLAFASLFLVFTGIGYAEFDPAKAGWRESPLQIGDEAPNFSLVSNTGESITLSRYRGKQQVVLYFYSRGFSPGCTRQAENFAKDFSAYDRNNAVILGVSVDSPNSQKNFATKLALPFSLLSDQGGSVAHQYGAMGWIMAKRVTYVIGLDGRVKQVFSDIDVEEHSREVLRSLDGGERKAKRRR